MTKTLSKVLMALCIVTCISSCGKEFNNAQMPVSFEQFSRTSPKLHIDSDNISWDEGDLVCVNNKEVSIFQGASSTQVYIDASTATPYNEDYCALIPKSVKQNYSQGVFTFDIPRYQIYREVGHNDHRQKVESPMVAKGRNSLNFIHVGGLLRITLPNSAVNIRQIKVELMDGGTSFISGQATISGQGYNTGDVVFSNKYSTVYLKCEVVNSTDSIFMNRPDHTYFIAVAPFSQQRLKISYYDVNGCHAIEMDTRNASVGRNQIAPIDLTSENALSKWQLTDAYRPSNNKSFVDLGDVDNLGNHILWSAQHFVANGPTNVFQFSTLSSTITNYQGGKWRLPSKSEMDKLISHPNSWEGNTITFKANNESTIGVSLTARHVYRTELTIDNGNNDCCYWTSTPASSSNYQVILLIDRCDDNSSVSRMTTDVTAKKDKSLSAVLVVQ